MAGGPERLHARPQLDPETRARDRDAEARKALASGLEQVGVLDSDRFSSLHPGYYVVFSGVYGSFSEANDLSPVPMPSATGSRTRAG